jgi:hypothetical protein
MDDDAKGGQSGHAGSTEQRATSPRGGGVVVAVVVVVVVVVVDEAYIDKIFNATNPADNNLINSTITDYSLNSQQERAFHIIANPATMKNPTKLCMYLGGMGGTGKSQVIKTLMSFF